jgi:predicted adenine nucleotide alpha hydrolase (AANH) superfamily ATPase
MSRVLLHACCGPCASHATEELKRLGHDVTLLFANANLATDEEFERRLGAARQLAEYMAVPLLVEPRDHTAWLRAVAGLEGEPEGGARCRACFRFNLAQTAARLGGADCDVFTTSLTISPLKRTADVLEAGQAVGGARFLPINFRQHGGFQRSVALAKTIGLYRQRDCGCEFSRRPVPEEKKNAAASH